MRTKALIFTTIIAVIFTFCACEGAQSSSAVVPGVSETTAGEAKRITPEEAKQMLDSDPGAILVDVRTEDEYQVNHIKGAILIPNDTIEGEKPQQLTNLNAVIILYCKSGNRSRQAGEKLIALGYTNVYNMGAISEWPYETEAGD